MTDLSIIIVTYNSEEDIGPCLRSIEDTRGLLQVEVFLVDNASLDGTLRAAEGTGLSLTILRNDQNRGFPAANNQAIPLATGRCIALLNPDTTVQPGALTALVEFMDGHPECGICGPVLVDEAGVLAEDLRRPTVGLFAIQFVGLHRFLPTHLSPERLEIVSGACLVFRRSLVSEVGVLDAELFWCEDVDYCVRARERGHGVAKVPAARVVHRVGASAKSNIGLVLEKQYTSKIKFLQKHASRRQGRAVVALFILQAAIRAAKWSVLAAVRPSPEARVRAATLARLVVVLPRYLHGKQWASQIRAAHPQAEK